MNKEFPCKCGHGMAFHTISSSRIWDACQACHSGIHKISFHTYKPDNLKYLELIEKREELKNG
jgi:hypothetical protein